MATPSSSSKSGGAKRKSAAVVDPNTEDRQIMSGSELNSPSKKRRQSNHGRVSKVEYEEPMSDEKDEETPMLEWTQQELIQLIHDVELQLPKPDKGKFSTTVLKIQWDKILVAGHEAEECKLKWSEVMTKLRRYRTMTDLVEDAKEWAKQPWTAFSMNKKVKHPDLPKKPLTPYFRFFMEKRKRLSQERPELSMTELAKLLAKKYAEMPGKKKQKYKEHYERENEEYKVLITKFKKEHPDLYPEPETTSRSARGSKQVVGPAKPQTAGQLFMAAKMTKHTNLDPPEKKEYEEKYRAQWKNLSNQKRVKWIRKAMASEQQYTLELAQFCLERPNHKMDSVKPVITKAEKAILDRFDGKPSKPPNSGYSLYSKIMLKEITDIPSKEKMTEISRRWKEMSEKERESYGKQAIDATEKYNRDYVNYLESLPDEDRKKLLESVKTGKKRTGNKSINVGGAADETSITRGQSKPKKPLSALFLYQQEKLPAYKEKHPDKSEQEVTRHLAREFGELSDKKKDKYKKLADEARKENAAAAQVRPDVTKGKLFKGQPKKPPQSGYLLYTTELISKLVTVEPKGRMAEISRRWKAMTVPEQEKYKKRAAELTKKYNKEHSKFIEGLSSEDRELYLQQKVKRGGGGNLASKGNSTLKTVKIEAPEEEDESSDDEKEGESESESGESKSDESSDDDDDSDKSDSDSGSDDSDSTNSNSSGSGNSRASSDSSSKSGSDDDDDEDGSGSDSDSGSEK